MTATERREHGSFQSSGNDNFDFLASVNSSNGVEFPKSHYLKRGCHKLLNFASRQRGDEVRLKLNSQPNGNGRRATNPSVERSPMSIPRTAEKNRMNHT